MDVLTGDEVVGVVCVASGMVAVLFDVSKGSEAVRVVNVVVGDVVGVVGVGVGDVVGVVDVGVGDVVGVLVGFGIDAEVVDLTNELQVVFVVDFNGVGHVGVDADDGLVGSL